MYARRNAHGTSTLGCCCCSCCCCCSLDYALWHGLSLSLCICMEFAICDERFSTLPICVFAFSPAIFSVRFRYFRLHQTPEKFRFFLLLLPFQFFLFYSRHSKTRKLYCTLPLPSVELIEINSNASHTRCDTTCTLYKSGRTCVTCTRNLLFRSKQRSSINSCESISVARNFA